MTRLAQLLTLLLLIGAMPASAGRITLDTETTCRSVADSARTDAGPAQRPTGVCDLRITNRGDEAATDLTIGLELSATVLAAERIVRLDPDTSWEGALAIAPGLLRTGRNGFVIRVDYHDHEGYPLAAVSHAYLDLGPPQPQDLQAKLSPVELSGDPRTAILEIHNSGTRRRVVTARMIVPRTLRSNDPSQEVHLEPGEDAKLTFTLDNFSAFADSTYRIYALLDSDLDGARQALFVPTTASVTSGERPTESLRIYLVALAGLLAGAWLMAQFSRRSRVRSAPPRRSSSGHGDRRGNES